jgi:hypothetical protein
MPDDLRYKLYPINKWRVKIRLQEKVSRGCIFVRIMNQFKITIKQQLLILFPFLTINAVVIAVYFYIFRDISLNIFIIVLFLFIFLLNVLPVLLLHLQYLIKNWNVTFKIDREKKLITCQNGKKSLKYSFDDIETLKYYATHGHISRRGSSLWYTFDPYRFYKITFKDQKKVIITCLMINNIENTLEQLLEITAERKFRVLPFTYD